MYIANWGCRSNLVHSHYLFSFYKLIGSCVLSPTCHILNDVARGYGVRTSVLEAHRVCFMPLRQTFGCFGLVEVAAMLLAAVDLYPVYPPAVDIAEGFILCFFQQPFDVV